MYMASFIYQKLNSQIAQTFLKKNVNKEHNFLKNTLFSSSR